MAKHVAIGGVVLVAVVGAGAAWFLGGSTGSGLDAAGRTLVELVETERRRHPIDRDECRQVLLQIDNHPASETDRDLIRARAWLEFLIGRTARALDLIEQNLGVDASSADQLLGSRVLARRFGESGDGDMAHRGATLAKNHYDATDDLASLFLAWQLQVRREDAERRGEMAEALQTADPDSNQARLVRVLVMYPGLREEAEGARAELHQLEQSFDVIPEELDLALALFEIEDGKTLGSCIERVERVLRTFPSSILARTLAGTSSMVKQDWAQARRTFESLLRRHPRHARARLWTQGIDTADRQLRGKK